MDDQKFDLILKRLASIEAKLDNLQFEIPGIVVDLLKSKNPIKIPVAETASVTLSGLEQELVKEAFEIIRQEKRASTSNLQHRMRLGYNRAAYVIDYLEKVGVLAPGEGAKPREILVDLETYNLEF